MAPTLRVRGWPGSRSIPRHVICRPKVVARESAEAAGAIQHARTVSCSVLRTMPSREKRCFLGSTDAEGRTAVAGCHGSSYWTRDRTMRTRENVINVAMNRLQDLVDMTDGLDMAVLNSVGGKEAAAQRLIAAAEARHRCPGATHCCIACKDALTNSWTVSSVTSFLAPLRSPSPVSSPPYRPNLSSPQTPLAKRRRTRAVTAQLTAPANLAHPTVLRELHWHLLGHPVRSRVGLALVCRDSAACFDELVGALDRNLAAARREPVLGSSVSLRTIMQNQLKLEVQNKELQEELQRLKRKEQKRA